MESKKSDVKEKYELTAQVYDARYEQIQTDKYVAMLEGLKITQPVLDLGCGTGLLLKILAKSKVFGCDISFEMLKKAKERGEFVVQADLDYLPFKTNTFAIVLSFTSLQNLPDTKQALKEAKRILKSSDGLFVLTMLKKSLNPDFYKHMKENFEMQEVKDIGEDAGFVLKKT